MESSNRTDTGLIDKLREQIKTLIRVADREVKDIRGSIRFVIMGLRMIVFVPRELINDNCVRLAAGLSYTTLLSLVPIFAIAFVVLGNYDISGNVQGLLLEYLVPEATIAVREQIVEFADTLQSNLQIEHSRTVTLMSCLILIFTSVSLLTTIERTLNGIWNTDHSRTFINRVAIYWSTLTLGPLLLALSIYLSAKFQIVSALNDIHIPLIQATGVSLIPIMFSCVAFSLAYLLLPNAHVKWRTAALGGVVAGIVWELAKHGFNWYVAMVIERYRSIYGPLGILPVFLLWIYLSWLIFLFGAELCYVTQNAETIAAIRRAAKQTAPVSARLAIAVIGAVCRRFLAAEPPPTPEEISAETGFFPTPVAQVARKLVEEGFLTAVEGGDGLRLMPSVAPDQISVRKVIRWANSTGVVSETAAGGPHSTCRSYDQMVDVAVEDATFETLAAPDRPEKTQSADSQSTS